MLRRVAVAIAVLAAASVGFSANARAVTLDCPVTFTQDGTAKVHDGSGAKLTAASDCEYISPPDNSVVANEDNVNDAEFFGINTWEVSPGSANQFDAEALTGTWEIVNPDFANFNYMIVFKDGSDTNLVGFLFNELFTSGGWDSPFVNPPFGVNNAKEVSHFTIFRTTGEGGEGGEGGFVPVPGTLLLLGAGLMGLAARGFVRSRGRR